MKMTATGLSMIAMAIAGPCAAQTPADRAGYAAQIERSLLSSGIDISVMAPEKPNPEMAQYDGFKGHPRLLLFGYLNKPFVFKVVAETPILETARKLGFRGVEFMDKGPDGRWFFHISGTAPLPRCDQNKRLCF